MTSKLLNLYARFRKESPFMLVGHNAELALKAAHTLMEWEHYEGLGLVRIKAEPEQESYFDIFDDYTPSERKRIEAIIERDGCWRVITEYRDELTGQWQHADSIGMNTRYQDPCSPWQNCYVIDMMQSALDKVIEPENAI